MVQRRELDLYRRAGEAEGAPATGGERDVRSSRGEVSRRVYATRRHQPVCSPTTPGTYTYPNLRPNHATPASLGTGRRGHRAPPTTRATARPPARTSPLVSPPTRAPDGQPASCPPHAPRGSSTGQRTLLGKPKRRSHLQGSFLTTDARHPEDGKRALPAEAPAGVSEEAPGTRGYWLPSPSVLASRAPSLVSSAGRGPPAPGHCRPQSLPVCAQEPRAHLPPTNSDL